MPEKRCLMLVDGKECGLPVTPAGGRNNENPNIYECPLGHRSVFVPVPVNTDPAKDA
jgi:hypothetical protein